MFQPDSVSIAKRLLEEFKDFGQRNETTGQIRIARIILLWLNNHFVDWEKNREMEKLLDEFEDAMENANMHNQLSLLNITCSAKANLRTVILFQFLVSNGNGREYPNPHSIYFHKLFVTGTDESYAKKSDFENRFWFVKI